MGRGTRPTHTLNPALCLPLTHASIDRQSCTLIFLPTKKVNCFVPCRYCRLTLFLDPVMNTNNKTEAEGEQKHLSSASVSIHLLLQ